MAVDARSRFAGEIVAVVVAPDRGRGASTPPSWSTSTTRSCPPVARHGAARSPTSVDLVHPDLGHERVAVWVFDSAEAGTGGDVDEAIAAARATRIVIERTIPPAAADPGVHGAALDRRRPDRRADDDLVGHPGPAHRASLASRWSLGIPEHKIRVIAPDVGGGFGGKLAGHAGGGDHAHRGAPARQAGEVHRDPQRVAAGRAPRPRPDPDGSRCAAQRDGTVTGLKVDLLADMGAYLGLVTPGDPDPRRLHVQRHLQVPGVPLRLHQRLHQHDLDRRLPRRRAAGGDVRHRADDGRARRRARRRPAGDARAELDQARGVPVHHGVRADATTPATTRRRPRKAKELFGYDELRAEQAAAPRAPATRCSSASASRRTPRCAGWRRRAVLGALGYVAGGWETRRRSGCCRPARSRWSPGPAPHGQGHETAWSQIVADRLGVPFEDVEVLHGDTADRRRRAWTPTAPARSSVGGMAVVAGGRQGDREGEADRGAHARGQRRTTSSSTAARSRVRGTDRARRSPSSRSRCSPAHDLPDGVEASLDAEATLDPENFSFPHGTHLCAVEVDTETGAVDHPVLRLRRRRRRAWSTR